MTIDVLRDAHIFSDLPEEVLQDLVADASTRDLAPGEVLLREGGPPDAAYVVISGELEVVKATPSGEVRINVCVVGDPVGELALASSRPRSATVRATQPSKVLEISVASFNKVLGEPRAVMALLSTVRRRLENQESQLRQHAKLLALGQQTAGLLHEINNPAAAIARNLEHLQQVDGRRTRHTVSLGAVDDDGWALLQDLAARTSGVASHPDPLERADRQDDLSDWLDDHGIDDADDLAGVLVDAGVAPDDLDRLAAAVDESDVTAAVGWVAATAEMRTAMDHSVVAVRRISEVVAAARSYVRLDEAPVGTVRVHEGLETALVLLAHKVRGAGVALVREYAEDLPDVEGYPAELNTVWTNLLDNAIDAVGGIQNPRVVVRTSFEGDRVVVEVHDNGGGIADEHIDRVFDPFFTTKDVGEGTGLGLSQALAIVTQRHHGHLEVTSEPGNTRFRVELPTRLPEAGD